MDTSVHIRLRPHCAGMLAVFALTVLSAAVLVWVQEPEFEVRARILVQPGSNALKTELALVRGKVLAEQVLAAVGAERLFPTLSHEEQIRQFQKRLKAESESDGSGGIIEIAFRHQQAAAAVQAADTLISLFRLQFAKIRDPQAARLEEQLVLARKQVRQAENKLTMFGQRNSFGEQRQLAGLKQQLSEQNEKLQELAEGLAALERQYAGPDDGRADLLRLKLYEHELLRKYEEQEPLIAEVRQQIRLAREEMRKAGSAGSDMEQLADQIVRTKIAWSGRKKAVDAAQKRLAQLEKQLGILAEQDETVKGMETELAESEEHFARLLARLEEGRQGSSVTVLEPPLPPLKPHRPDTLRNLLAAAVLGLGGGLLYAVLRSRGKIS